MLWRKKPVFSHTDPQRISVVTNLLREAGIKYGVNSKSNASVAMMSGNMGAVPGPMNAEQARLDQRVTYTVYVKKADVSMAIAIIGAARFQ